MEAFITEGQWNMEKIKQIALPQMMSTILAAHLQLQRRLPNQAIWKPHGLFSSPQPGIKSGIRGR